MDLRKPTYARGEDMDELNDETFGGGAVEDDWEASHFAEVGREEGNSLEVGALQHDDAILDAVPSVTTNHTPKLPTGAEGEELDSSIASLSLKELWPSSPQQAAVSKLESIWSSPDISRATDQQATPTIGKVPPGQVISLEELERELTSSPPPSSSPLPPPPHSHHSPLPQQNSPPPPHMMFMARPPPHGPHPLPMHAFMTPGWHIRGPPPPPHLLPPHMLHSPHRPQPPPGVLPYHPPHPPPLTRHPFHPHPPRYPLLPRPPPPSQQPSPPHSQHPPPRDPSPRSEHIRSRRSELLSEMKADGSGFMTQKEKEWIVKIQLLQLQGSDPENDDYYYLNYVQQRARRESDDSAPFSLALPQVSREEKNYRPVKFEHTLGKVSQSSLSAPRRTIDVPSAGGTSSEGGGGGGGREATARKRQILLIIEKLYTHALSLEDIDKRALALSTEERGVVLESKESICAEIFTLLRLNTLEESGKREEQMFQQMTSYRKGKRLLKRVLPVLTDAHAQAVLLALLRNIVLITKRDITDQALPELIPALKGVISTCDLQLVTRCLSTLLALPAGSNTGSLVKLVSCEFGSSLVLSLVRHGNLLCDSPYKTRQLTNDWLTATHHLHTTLSPHSHQLHTLSTNSALLVSLPTSLQ